MPKIQRNWTVLFIGGASGSGKSSTAYEIASYYDVNVLEIDDLYEADVKIMFIKEEDENQIVQNYYSRERGELQNFRAKISASYSLYLSKLCEQTVIKTVEARPWGTVIERALANLNAVKILSKPRKS